MNAEQKKKEKYPNEPTTNIKLKQIIAQSL